MLRKMFQNFTANSSWQLCVEFHYIQKLHWPVTTFLKRHCVHLPSSCENKPDLHVPWAALWSLGLNLVLDVESHICLEGEALTANWGCGSVAPKADGSSWFTCRSEAEDQDYRAIQELIFLIHSKWNNRIYNGWVHWKNVCLKTC